jgi:hypothetical protein
MTKIHNGGVSMEKSLLTVLSLMLASVALESDAARGMSPSQQEACRKACQKRGDKWDPTSAASKKGCTCETGEGESYTITDADLNESTLDNVVGKSKE